MKGKTAVCLVWLLALAGAARAQTSPPTPSATDNVSQALAPDRAAQHALWLGIVGAAGGALLGARGLSFSGVPAPDRTAHEWRAGVTYGLIGGSLAAALGAALTMSTPPEPHRFFLDRWNTPLFAGIAAVQVLDYTSTRDFRNHGRDEWLLTNSLVDHRGAFIATEAAAAGAAVGLAYLFHRSGHHRLERWVAGGYIAIGAASAAGNYHYATTGHDIFGQGGIF